MLNTYFGRLFAGAMSLNKKNILNLVGKSFSEKFIDLGCADGQWTLEVAKSAQATSVSGVELIEEQASEARRKNIDVKLTDLNARLPFQDQQFDLVHANQVIEHVANVDNFAAEVYRILKPGG